MAQGTPGRTPGRAQARIHPAIPAAIAVVVCGVLIALVAGSGGDDSPVAAVTSTTTSTSITIPDPTTTTSIPPEPVFVEELLATSYPESPPRSYRITYDVVENELPREEVWTVRRPYESLVESTRDGAITTATATSLDALYTYLADKQGWLRIQGELHRAAFDLRPLPNLGAMVALGLAEPVGDAEYLGRPCRIFRTGQPSGVAEPTPPSAAESTELCVDARGLILHEVWRLDGKLITERTATAIDEAPAIPDGLFDPEPEIEDAEEFEALLGQIAVEADDETEARLRTDVPLPAGFTLDATVLRTGTPGQNTAASTEIIRFLSDGTDLVEYAEVFADGTAQLGRGAAVPVEIEGRDEVWFAPGVRESAVRLRVSESSYVELRGPDPAQLFELLATLTLR